MARYRATINTRQDPEAAFAYLSDFSTSQEWDPGVVEAERLDPGKALGPGTQFRLVAEFMGRQTPITYRIVVYEPPYVVTFVGENKTAVSRATITFEATSGGSRVTYDAALKLKGLLRVADPLLRIAFRRTGNRARAGLTSALA